MTDEKNLPKMPRIRKSRSVWTAHGIPMNHDGTSGPDRGCLFLMPMTANPGDVVERFILECNESDSKEYYGAKVSSTRYLGWVWLPDERPNWRDAGSPMMAIADIEEVLSEMNELHDGIVGAMADVEASVQAEVKP